MKERGKIKKSKKRIGFVRKVRRVKERVSIIWEGFSGRKRKQKAKRT